jgi:hypothetical protein
MPVDTRLSNGAYLVMAALAWTLKAWLALRLPTTGRWAPRYAAAKAAVLRMEFPSRRELVAAVGIRLAVSAVSGFVPV